MFGEPHGDVQMGLAAKMGMEHHKVSYLGFEFLFSSSKNFRHGLSQFLRALILRPEPAGIYPYPKFMIKLACNNFLRQSSLIDWFA